MTHSGSHFAPVPQRVEESSGGKCDYYQVTIHNPTTVRNIEGQSVGNTYIAECNDIIEELNMTFAEANIFKEVWRTAAARTLGKQKLGHTRQRAAEKILFFAKRYASINGN